MKVFTDVERGMFNVVIVKHENYGEVVNNNPLMWEDACKWVKDLLTGIGRDWDNEKYEDVYLEMVSCPRPWTPELLSMFTREQIKLKMELAESKRRAENRLKYLREESTTYNYVGA